MINVCSSPNDPRLLCVVIESPVDPHTFVTDPFSSGCSRFQVNPTTEWGVTAEDAQAWFDAVNELRREKMFDESTVFASDAWIMQNLVRF